MFKSNPIFSWCSNQIGDLHLKSLLRVENPWEHFVIPLGESLTFFSPFRLVSSSSFFLFFLFFNFVTDIDVMLYMWWSKLWIELYQIFFFPKKFEEVPGSFSFVFNVITGIAVIMIKTVNRALPRIFFFPGKFLPDSWLNFETMKMRLGLSEFLHYIKSWDKQPRFISIDSSSSSLALSGIWFWIESSPAQISQSGAPQISSVRPRFQNYIFFHQKGSKNSKLWRFCESLKLFIP